MKKKKDKRQIESRGEMELLVSMIIQLQNQHDEKLVKLNKAIHKIKSVYDVKITQLEENIDELKLVAQDWFNRNLPQEEKKSIEMVHGIVGYRTPPPALKLLKGWTWEKVLAKLEAEDPDQYIRYIKEVDKETLLAHRGILAPAFQSYGLKVSQKDKFFVDPIRTEPDPVTPSKTAA